MIEEIRNKIGEELERLAHELNIILPKAIQRAVELGDLRENSEYKSALERQQFVQARIQHLSQRMSELSKIDVTAIPHDRVGFGSRVTVEDPEGERFTYTIVAGDYMDVDAGQISLASPIGRSLLGKVVGEEVVVQLPGRERHLRVVELTTLPQMVGTEGEAA